MIMSILTCSYLLSLEKAGDLDWANLNSFKIFTSDLASQNLLVSDKIL